MSNTCCKDVSPAVPALLSTMLESHVHKLFVTERMITCPAGDPVVVDKHSATSFLSRTLLYNSMDFELVVPGNLERECIEEQCNYEEAREVFEDDAKTVMLLYSHLHDQLYVSNPLWWLYCKIIVKSQHCPNNFGPNCILTVERQTGNVTLTWIQTIRLPVDPRNHDSFFRECFSNQCSLYRNSSNCHLNTHLNIWGKDS